MMAPAPGVYNEIVFGRCWRGAAVLLLACSCWLGLGARATAAQQIAVGPNPWLDVQLQSGTLTVNTWDRPDVQISSSGRLDVKHVGASVADPRIPRQYTAWSQSVSTGSGDARLPEESFVLPQLQGSSHDAVVADGQGNTTITVPRGTALVTARVGTGQLNLNGYHGAFITQVRDGGISFNHVDGSGYAEALRGPIQATDSTFDRLRARTATGNMFFRGCTSHQIEATSKYGSIVYDNGRFQPGLAHFESEHGNVALGVRGGAQIGAHSGTGHVVSSFHNGSAATRNRNSTQETVRGGGPVVTAVSKHGSVFLYNGSVGAHPRVQAELRGSQTRQGAPAQVFAPANASAPVRSEVPARNFAPRNYAPPRDYSAPGYGRRRFTPQQQQPYAPPGYAQPRPAGPYGQPQPRQGPPASPRQGPPQGRAGGPPGGGGSGGGGGHHHQQPPS